MMNAPRTTVNVPEDLYGDDGDVVEGDTPRGDEEPGEDFLRLVSATKKKLEKRKTKSKTVAAAVFNRALAEVDEMLRSGDWESGGARHLVALYDRLHHRCYGVEPVLSSSERFNAGLLAGAMLKREFSGDVDAMVEFMIWAWNRELERERWRRENGREGGRIGVHLMFSGALLTDYRIHLVRRRKRQ